MKNLMSTRYLFLLWWIFAYNYLTYAQADTNDSIKTVTAVRTATPPKIDGTPDEAVWQAAPPATGFYEFQPGDGNPLPPAYHTEVRILYDDAYLYVSAVMHDPHPDKISREFSLRDQEAQADYFALMLNPFKVPGNTYVFSVMASGAQMDGIQGKHSTDLSWNAVWKSAVDINERGWSVEMAIPYSALRFSEKNTQEWAVDFVRYITATRQTFSWTPIDKTKDVYMVEFMGRLKGLSNLKPPVRLSLYPYSSVIVNHYEGQTDSHLAYGMDLKYGLNANYTLDATLIPDFSDVPYDDVVLNLGPFEQYYSEKRPFFTEGMQLFSTGRLFYSRRIGSQPVDYYKVFLEQRPSEIILENPEKTQLLNAIKISGRSNNGLGLGIMNAFVNRSEAVLQDTVTGEIREIETQPYTNYNIMVADYAFKDNNSISLVNTNVTRFGPTPDANASALVMHLYGMDKTLSMVGVMSVSATGENLSTVGQHYVMELRKTVKNHKFETKFFMSDDKYDINDMGYMRTNNYVIYDFAYKYRILKPTKHWNNFGFSVDVGLDHLYKPYGLYRKDLGIEAYATDKNYLSYGGRISLISDTKDYYEPRVDGRYYLDPAHTRGRFYISSDYRKRFALDGSFWGSRYFDTDQYSYNFGFRPRFRFTNRFKMIYQFNMGRSINDRGFVDIQNDSIIFGKRDIKTVTQSLRAQYFFDVKSGINVNLRHYWSPVTYKEFYVLRSDGTLEDIPYDGLDGFNFNVWNLDIGYTWEFAPGSQMSLLYRNNIFNSDNEYLLSYGENLHNLFAQPQKHTFILKAIYYLDYNTVRRKWF